MNAPKTNLKFLDTPSSLHEPLVSKDIYMRTGRTSTSRITHTYIQSNLQANKHLDLSVFRKKKSCLNTCLNTIQPSLLDDEESYITGIFVSSTHWWSWTKPNSNAFILRTTGVDFKTLLPSKIVEKEGVSCIVASCSKCKLAPLGWYSSIPTSWSGCGF